jgi:hypothetical protein
VSEEKNNHVEILTCPFCGKPPRVARRFPDDTPDDTQGSYMISCWDDCHSVAVESTKSKDEAIRIWSTRK